MRSVREQAGHGPERVHLAVSALLVLVGSILFVHGGRQHPPTDESMGEIGSAGYFEEFVVHVAGSETWRAYHTEILLGPVSWSLGAVGLALLVTARGGSRGFATTGLFALGLGTMGWIVVFVLDGFVAPLQASAAIDSGLAESTMLAFRSNQEIVVRLGAVSWILLGLGVVGLSVALLTATRLRRPGRWLVGGAGLLMGGWPVVAWAIGEFRPGPFTSPTWVPTVLLTSGWFVVVAVLTGAGAVGRSQEPSAR